MTSSISRPVDTLMMFDPIRVRALQERTEYCAEAIGRISLPDPAADHAISICRQITSTLNEMWLPMIRDVLAMVSFSAYESAFHNQPISVQAYDSSRFAPRWAGRARSAAMRRERALRAAQFSCAAPWLKRAPRHLTRWTWSELKQPLRDLRVAIRQGGDITKPLRALEQILHKMASEAISDPSHALLSATSHRPEHQEAQTAVNELFSVLALLGGAGLHNVNHDATDQFSRASQAFGSGGAYGSVGASTASLINVWMSHSETAASAPAGSRNEGILDKIVRNGGLLNILSANLELLENYQLIDLAAGVLEETERQKSAFRVRNDPPVSYAIGPIMGEILSREGGVALMNSFATARLALIGDPVAPGDEFRATLRAALGEGTAQSVALNAHRGSDTAVDLAARVEVLDLLRLLTEEVETLKLHPSVSRSLAVALGPILGDLLPHLEQTGTVIVTLLPTDGAAPHQVTLGSYQDLTRTFGHIMQDRTSQMVLGMNMGQVITDRSRAAAELLRDNPQLSDPMRFVESVYADNRRGITLLNNGPKAYEANLAFALGLSISRSITAVNFMSLAIPVSSLPISRILNLTFPMLLSVLGLDQITELPSYGLESDLAIVFSTSALRIPIDNPDLRQRLGLVEVSADTWDRYEAIVNETEQGEVPAVREAKMSILRAMLRQDPALHGYLNSVRSGSGDL
jgi:hypothetical protein